MHRTSLIAVLMGFLLSNACLADETAFCKPACDEERRVCKAKGRELAEDDNTPFLSMGEKNVLARAAARGQVPSEAARAGERVATQSRRLRHAEACDDTYARCTRACASPAAAAPESPAIFNRRKAG